MKYIFLIQQLTKKCFLLLFAGAFIFSLRSSAQGDLLLYPKRIVFEGSKKSQTLNIANTGNDTVRYFISVVQMRMKEDGSFETINDPDSAQYFADKNFRFFPRNVVLGPNESQTVKMQLINTSEMVPGEYRSHLYFRAEEEKLPLGANELAIDPSSISVRLVSVFGISIPVIIRIGESTSKVSFSHVSLIMKDSVPKLKIDFDRTGNMSLYGDVSVDHISEQGKVTRIGIAKGMALYTPNPVRHFNLLLDTNLGINYHKGKLKIAYTTQPDAKSVKMAETELLLN